MTQTIPSAQSLTRQLLDSPSRHVQLALVHVPGPTHAIEAQPYLRISFNIGPSFEIDVEGPLGRQKMTCRRHSLMIIPPDLTVTHRAALPKPAGRAYTPVELATFRISRELVAECAMHLGLSDKHARFEHEVVVSDEVLRPLATALLAQLRMGCPDGPLAAERIAAALLSCILSRQARTGPTATADALARVLTHVESNLHVALSLDELAAIAGMSRFHFCRVFRVWQGVTPHQFIVARRIELAKQLLWARPADDSAAANVLGVALACGFASASHFSSQFKRHVGKTPVQWQRARPGAA
ncbi:AraC family transcriptional regulator [Polaromonas sp.]|uniref:AraC family transcriptional regulator n=1 Tax=Polaromonas sp. TaxID=1869339 RepID=UPI002731564A|nr:AraC family transcriptional regulator [Polaromonas sp.]MDP1741523.1 AraC family transcriptional regulator [Polaromonas sp.]